MRFFNATIRAEVMTEYFDEKVDAFE